MAKTKKVGVTGKYGPRYGRTIRQTVKGISETQRSLHKCTSCLNISVKRISVGIWQCKKCGLKFAGKAYKPS